MKCPTRALVFASVLGAACGGDDSNETLTGVSGMGSADDGPPPATDGGAGDDDDGGATMVASSGAVDDGADAADAPADDDGAMSSSTAAGDDGMNDGTTTPPAEDTGPPPKGTTFGECAGTGAWESCAMWCAANDADCVEAGCDGATVMYYGDVRECTAMESGSAESHACDEPFSGGGGISFARCCCAF